MVLTKTKSYFKVSKHPFSYWKCPLKGLFWKFQNMLITFFLSHFSKNWAHFYKINFSFSFRIHLRIFRFWLKAPRNKQLKVLSFFQKPKKPKSSFYPPKWQFSKFYFTVSYCTHKVCLIKVTLKSVKNERGWSYKPPEIPKNGIFSNFGDLKTASP